MIKSRKSQSYRVLKAIHDSERALKKSERGLTDKQMQRLVRLPGDSQRPRRVALHQQDLIQLDKQMRNGENVWRMSYLGFKVLKVWEQELAK